MNFHRQRRGWGAQSSTPILRFQNHPSSKHIPGSETPKEEIFDFPFLCHKETVECIKNHGQIMFIIRGPSGTGKSSLSELIEQKYPNCVVCSADNYFSEGFVAQERNKASLSDSHAFCQKRAREECQSVTSPIVIQNTHMRSWELNTYLHLAKEFSYTVIMAITLRKFKVDPETLERCNKKGLSREYFIRRLNSWEECIPMYLGWFLGLADSSFIMNEAKNTLEALLDDGKFCKTYNVYSEDDIWSYYKTESLLFCIATFCNEGHDSRMRALYLSKDMQNVYGKSFKLTIQGFAVTKTQVLAIVRISLGQKQFMLKPRQQYQHNDHDICGAVEILSVHESQRESAIAESRRESATAESQRESATAESRRESAIAESRRESAIAESQRDSAKTFQQQFSTDGITIHQEDWRDEEVMNISYMSFICIASKAEKFCIRDPEQHAKDMVSELADEYGSIDLMVFSELDNGTKYCRLANDSWLVKLPRKLCVNAIFTGLYLPGTQTAPQLNQRVFRGNYFGNTRKLY